MPLRRRPVIARAPDFRAARASGEDREAEDLRASRGARSAHRAVEISSSPRILSERRAARFSRAGPGAEPGAGGFIRARQPLDLSDARTDRETGVLRFAFPRITIIDRYVAREVLAPFGMGVGLLTFTLVTGRLLKLTEMVVNHGVSLGEVLGLIAFIMPAFLELTFPMAVLLGVLLGFGRMSGDREMIAARACGMSLYRLAVPVMAVAFVVYAVASLVRVFGAAVGQLAAPGSALLPDPHAGGGRPARKSLQRRHAANGDLRRQDIR